MASVPAARGSWGSRAGFILAAAGSAIGLGNIWRFPTTAGQSGGAAFVFIYLACVLAIGLPVMLAEMIIGRRTQRNPVGAYAALAPGTPWRFLGGAGVLAGLGILSFYSVIAGWTVGYVFETVAGRFSHVAGTAQMADAFTALSGSAVGAVGLHAAFMVLTMLVVLGGIEGGIERWSKLLMPLLLAILVLLVVRSVTLPGAERGLTFYLRPDFSHVSATTFLEAVGQAFFSLSLGMGAMITYGSYLSKKEDLVTSALWVTMADTTIAFLAGLVIFPALFTIEGLEPTIGPSLIFVVLPSIFDQIPGGQLFGTGFFVLLVIAALTSSISLLEVVVSYFIDEQGWSRRKAVLAMGTTAFLLGVPSALSQGAVGWLSRLPGLGVDFLSLMNTVFGDFTLTIGALLLSVFVGWRWGVPNAVAEAASGAAPGWFRPSVWAFLIRYLCPLAIGAILVRLIWQLFA